MCEKMTLTDDEIKWLLTSPKVMRVLADYHDYQQTLADASDMRCTGNDARYRLFKAEAERIEAEWDAEHEPDQRVFLPAHPAQPAQAVDVVAWRWRMTLRADLPWNTTTDAEVIRQMQASDDYETEPLTRALGNANGKEG